MHGRVRVPARARPRFPGRYRANEDEARTRRQPLGPATAPAGRIGQAAVLALQRTLGNAGAGRTLMVLGHPGAANLLLQRAAEDEELLREKEEAQRAAQAQAAAGGGEAEAARSPGSAEAPGTAGAAAVNAAREAAAADQAAAEQEQTQSVAQVEAREAEQAKEQEQEAARDAEAALVAAPAASEPSPGEVPAEGSKQAEQPPLPAIEDEGGPFPAVGRGSVSLTGRTRASFRSSFRVENERVEPGTSCDGCGRRNPCVHVTGNLVITFTVTTRVTLPRVPRGLTACQRERVRAAIRDTLSPHEDQHVAAFETYNGTVTLPFDEEMCRSRYGRFIRTMARDEERTRRAEAQAASDALDPFNVDVDLDCTDE